MDAKWIIESSDGRRELVRGRTIVEAVQPFVRKRWGSLASLLRVEGEYGGEGVFEVFIRDRGRPVVACTLSVRREAPT